MPVFPNASIAIGFNFWDDNVSNDHMAVVDKPTTTCGDDLPDTQSNANGETSYIPRNGTPGFISAPSMTFMAVNGTTTAASATAAMKTPPLAPGNGMPTPCASLDAEVVPHFFEPDSEEESGASEAEVRTRADGQTFVKQRKITADLDMTDQMIVNLKNANHPNEYIANELRKHGLVPYDKKTVGSRFNRLQKKITEREAQRLEDGLTDWHEGEDEALLRADELAQNEIKGIIQRAKARRWQIVSRNLHKILKKELKYGPKACEKRFVELMDDRASIPIELDDHPEERRAGRAKLVLEKMNMRNLIEAREKMLKEQKRLAADQNALRIAMEKSKRAQERAERAVEKAKEAKAKALVHDQEYKTLEIKRQTEETRITATSKKYAERYGLAYTALLPHTSPAIAALATPTSTPAHGAIFTPTSTVTKRKRKPTDPEVAESPRSHMSVKELGDLLSSRGLSKAGTKSDQIKRLAAHDQNMSPKTLKAKLSGYGADTEGNRQQLIERLVQREVCASAWGQKHAGALGAKV